jgi:cell division protein FtsL
MATVTSPGRAASARTRTAPRRPAPARAPRRVSGPVGGRAATATAAAVAPRESLALGGRALALVRGLPDHSLIDRLVRGRAWIPLLGVLLAGIVAMQVEILKLGASTGRAIEQTATLQTRNEALQAGLATLADDQRIERIAATQGMVIPSPDSLVFLTARPGAQIGRAVGNVQAPNPSAFTSQLAAQAAADAALMGVAASTSSTPTSPSSSGQPSDTSETTPTIAATTPAPVTSQSPPAASSQSTVPTSPATSTTTPATSGVVSAPAATATGVATGAAGIAPTTTQPSGG